MSDQNAHVLYAPEDYMHDTTGTNCPCMPELFAPCDECGESTGGSEGCWKCQGDGMLFLPDGYPGPFVVVHGSFFYPDAEPPKNPPWLAIGPESAK